MRILGLRIVTNKSKKKKKIENTDGIGNENFLLVISLSMEFSMENGGKVFFYENILSVFCIAEENKNPNEILFNNVFPSAMQNTKRI